MVVHAGNQIKLVDYDVTYSLTLSHINCLVVSMENTNLYRNMRLENFGHWLPSYWNLVVLFHTLYFPCPYIKKR